MDTISTENLSNLLDTAQTYAIITHKRPDGDAISSSLALFWYLLDAGKNADSIDIIIPEYLDDFSFIPGIEHIKIKPTKEFYDVVLVVDCASIHLLEGVDIFKCSNKIVCFDHHDETTINFDYAIIDPSAPSCTCIIYETFNCKKQDFSTCIAVGLISDTNNLTLNSSSRGISVIHELVNNGVDTNFIVSKLTSPSNRTLELTRIAKYRGCWYGSIYCTYIFQEDLLDSEKSLNTVNHKAIIAELQKDIKYTFLIFVIENNKGEWKGSMRTSDSRVDLNSICSKLVAKGKFIKGGGHSYSSGFTAVGEYSNIVKTIIHEITNY